MINYVVQENVIWLLYFENPCLSVGKNHAYRRNFVDLFQHYQQFLSALMHFGRKMTRALRVALSS